MDLDIDRAQGLNSIPPRFGVGRGAHDHPRRPSDLGRAAGLARPAPVAGAALLPGQWRWSRRFSPTRTRSCSEDDLSAASDMAFLTMNGVICDGVPGRCAGSMPSSEPAIAAPAWCGASASARPWTALDLRVAAGETVLVTGPNGAGKTTLLRVLATVLRPTAGDGPVGRPRASRARPARPPGDRLRGPRPARLPGARARENLELYAALYGRGQRGRGRPGAGPGRPGRPRRRPGGGALAGDAAAAGARPRDAARPRAAAARRADRRAGRRRPGGAGRTAGGARGRTAVDRHPRAGAVCRPSTGRRVERGRAGWRREPPCLPGARAQGPGARACAAARWCWRWWCSCWPRSCSSASGWAARRSPAAPGRRSACSGSRRSSPPCSGCCRSFAAEREGRLWDGLLAAPVDRAADLGGAHRSRCWCSWSPCRCVAVPVFWLFFLQQGRAPSIPGADRGAAPGRHRDGRAGFAGGRPGARPPAPARCCCRCSSCPLRSRL